MNNSKHLKNVLLNSISSLSLHHRDFLIHPDTDFTRKRKLSLEDTIFFILSMKAGSIKDELYKYFGLHLDNPTSSAFVQQRNKIKPEAFQWLFNTFNKKTKPLKGNLFMGFRLVAIDGSSVPISHNPHDTDTYIKQLTKHYTSARGHNAFHLNASYDLVEHTYDDVVIQGEAVMNENRAFNELVDRYHGDKAIFIADRGYES